MILWWVIYWCIIVYNCDSTERAITIKRPGKHPVYVPLNFNRINIYLAGACGGGRNNDNGIQAVELLLLIS